MGAFAGRTLLILLLVLAGCGGVAVDPWQPGELLVEQIGLTGEAIGEAALVIGPDGTTVLIDVGNDAHADQVIEALERHRGEAAVDWVLLTHFHADHIGGFDRLFAPSNANGGEPIPVRGGVISRGEVDIGSGGANRRELEPVSEWGVEHPELTVELCRTGTPRESCEPSADGGPWPADACPGLEGGSGEIALGDGAVLSLIAVGGWVRTAGGAERAHDLDGQLDDDAENGRSVVAALTYGDFAMVFGGDLTGGGKGTADVEAAVAAAADWPGHPLPAGGVDVIQLNHHGIDSSSGVAWLDWLLPADGTTRHALVGANSAYLAAPDRDVVDRVAPRLNGGTIWVTRRGSLGARDDAVRVAGGSVAIRVDPGGGSYAVELGE